MRFLLSFAFLSLLSAPSAFSAEVVLRVANPATATNETVVALLFDSADAFADLRNPILRLSLPAGGAQPATIPDLPPGDYAVVVYRDANGNGRLDKNFIGIPREYLGFSNNYWPEGPPTFARAAFTLGEGESKAFDFELQSVFGELGRLGVGIGLIAQTGPYRDSDENVLQPIPAISYIGDRVQIFGPNANIGLLRFGEAGLAATASYRPGAFSDDDSPVLRGLGDRKGTLMAGLALQADLPLGLEISAGWEQDTLGRSAGGAASAGLQRSFQTGLVTFSPSLTAQWMSGELAGYEFGVPSDRALPDRPAYRPGDAVNLQAGLGVMIDLRSSWRLMVNGGVTFLDSALTRSPIVEEDRVYSGFMALTRLL
jgi:outer membrane protein